MIVLSLDTSTPTIFLALYRDGKHYSMKYKGHEKHAVRLAPLLDYFLKTVGVSPKDIDLFGTGIGPGGLTGLRIGIATVVGMASPFNKPIVPIPSFHLMVLSFPLDGRIAVVRKARKGFFYCGIYDKKSLEIREISSPSVISEEDLLQRIKKEKMFVIGDGIRKFGYEDYLEISGEVLVGEALKRKDEKVSYYEIEPLYIQKSIAEMKLKSEPS